MLSPIPAFAACQSIEAMSITMKPYSTSGPADGNWIGQQIGDWGGAQTNYKVFDFTGGACKYGAISWATPTTQPLAGVTHVDAGVSYPVYPSGIPGIGYVIGIRDPKGSQWTSVRPPDVTVYPGPGTATTPQSSLGFTFQVKLIATGRLQAGSHTLPSKTVATLQVADSDGLAIPGALTVDLRILGTTINVSATGCTVTQGAKQTVTLPPAYTGEFKGGMGSILPQSASFSVGVTCDPNIALYATMSDASTPGNTSDVLSLARSSTAAGIGLKLFKFGESTPLKFGPDSSARGNTNQWYVGKSSSAVRNFTVPFRVNYVQTAPEVKAGKVNAQSTITFSYQ